MRILISGAGGFIGRHLISALPDHHEVFGIVRNAVRRPLPGARAHLLEFDLAHPLDMKELPGQIDVIVHLAQANVLFPEAAKELLAVNTVSTQHLLDYGRRAGAQRFILASTGDVYGRRFELCKESDTLRAATFYALTKQAAELLTQAYSGYLQTCILRLFHPYGSDQSNRLIPNLADRLRRQETVPVHKDDRPRLTPIYIDDVVTAIMRAMDSSYCGIVNVAGDRVVSIRELTEEIGRALKSKSSFEASGEESGDMMGDNALMKQVFGAWPMITLSEGLSRTFNGKETTA